jgi:hypothetical protein
MSEPSEPQISSADGEELDGLVVSERRSVSRRFGPGARVGPVSGGAQVVQAAAVAATGFLAGAAVVGLVAHRRQRSPTRARSTRQRARSSGAELVQIVASRSLLVDLHLLGPGGDR